MIEKKEFIIKIRIESEDDLYHPFDEDRKLLNDDVISYIERKYSEKHFGEKLLVHILCDKKVNESAARDAFRRYIENEADNITREQRLNNARQIRLFLIGVLFIALWLALSANTENILIEILSIIGSFSIWEAANIWIVDKPALRIRKKHLNYLSGTEIIFSHNTPHEEPKETEAKDGI